jgi:hypothetical protein
MTMTNSLTSKFIIIEENNKFIEDWANFLEEDIYLNFWFFVGIPIHLFFLFHVHFFL